MIRFIYRLLVIYLDFCLFMYYLFYWQNKLYHIIHDINTIFLTCLIWNSLSFSITMVYFQNYLIILSFIDLFYFFKKNLYIPCSHHIPIEQYWHNIVLFEMKVGTQVPRLILKCLLVFQQWFYFLCTYDGGRNNFLLSLQILQNYLRNLLRQFFFSS